MYPSFICYPICKAVSSHGEEKEHDTSKKIIILGAGRRGVSLARKFASDGKNIVIIDHDPERIERAQSRVDCLGVLGSGTDMQILSKAGIEGAGAFVAVTDSDEVNLISCALVSSASPTTRSIAAVKALRYTGADGLKEGLLGIDYIVNPTTETAGQIYRIIEEGVQGDVLSFTQSNLLLTTITVSAESKWEEYTVAELRVHLDALFVIASILRKGKILIPSGETRVAIGDQLIIIAPSAEVRDILQQMGQVATAVQRIVLIGAGELTEALLSRMSLAMRANTTVIDVDQRRCQQINERFAEVLVLNADITDEEVMNESEMSGYDLLGALTDNDELNIITASYAKRVEIGHSIALIRDNINYERMAPSLGIDTVISTTGATVESLLRYLRSSNITSLHTLYGGQLDIYEFLITDKSACQGKRLKEIDMRKKAIVAALIDQAGHSLVPSGETLLQAGDTVLVAALHSESGLVQTLFG